MEDTLKRREVCDRLILLLITQPLKGWEGEFREITRREIERLSTPARGAAEQREERSGANS